MSELERQLIDALVQTKALYKWRADGMNWEQARIHAEAEVNEGVNQIRAASYRSRRSD